VALTPVLIRTLAGIWVGICKAADHEWQRVFIEKLYRSRWNNTAEIVGRGFVWKYGDMPDWHRRILVPAYALRQRGEVLLIAREANIHPDIGRQRIAKVLYGESSGSSYVISRELVGVGSENGYVINSYPSALGKSKIIGSELIRADHCAQNESVNYDIRDQPEEGSPRVLEVFLCKIISAIAALWLSWRMVGWGWWQVTFNSRQKGNIGLVICFLSALPMAYAFWALLSAFGAWT
jgi:hypothetical protein